MTESLSVEQARRLVLFSQQFRAGSHVESPRSKTLSTIKHLGYIQIDTISVVQRAHHHTLWSRNAQYDNAHVDELLESGEIFEYWSHAAAYLPMCDYRFSLPRKAAVACGSLDHWYGREERLMKRVRDRIRQEGPLMARDFEGASENSGGWGSKPFKRALEYLFMQGELMIPRRVNFQKVYDLTERVLPESVNTSPPDAEEYSRHLITRYLQANGVGKANEITYLLKGTQSAVKSCVQEMLSEKQLIEVLIDGDKYLSLPQSLGLLQKSSEYAEIKFLSPFDNLLIQRKRALSLFDFDYRIECYLPAAKRQYGYFSLPILWREGLVARADCKVDRSTSTLHIYYLALEPHVSEIEAFCSALTEELPSFMKFNNCTRLEIHKTSPAGIGVLLRSENLSRS